MSRKKRNFARTSRPIRLPQSTIKSTDIPDESYRSFNSFVARINFYLSCISGGLAAYSVLAYELIVRMNKAVFWGFLVAFCLVYVMKINFQANTLRLFEGPFRDSRIHQKFRRRASALLALSFFQIAVTAFPILYLHGYVGQFTTWLQSWSPGKQLGEKFSISTGFVVAAIVSGILGNFAYDILKHIFKNIRKI